MAATLSSTGTWTPVAMTTTDQMTADKSNHARYLDDFNGFAIQDADYPELMQFIDLMAAGLGIGHTHAVNLLTALLAAKSNREVPVRQATNRA